ncbi:MAG: response regulator transcription factor [Bacteroidetes bacterium]|nr:response regulator transcription factor [Bacteroidota bacterium]
MIQSTFKAQILLAEDDTSLAFMMKDSLEDYGFKVTHCLNGKEAIEIFNKNIFDICLLDVMMPEKDGFMVAKKIRAVSDVMPILFISTKVLEEDKLQGYQTGADDYITKPFSIQELLMKIDVFLRRTKKLNSATSVKFLYSGFDFNYNELKLKIDTEENLLTQKEADLLRFFCEHPNVILKRDEILLNVWGKEDFFLGRSMDVYITKLRKMLKLLKNVSIETIHTVGYKFVVPEA